MRNVAISAVLLMTACAQPPDLIKPTATSDVLYVARSCQDLQSKLDATDKELGERSQVQLSNDASASNAGHIAKLKGRHDVISETMRKKNCPLTSD